MATRFGLLHRIPPPAEHLKSGLNPPDLEDLDEEDDEGVFVPADITANGYHDDHAHHNGHHDGQTNGYQTRALVPS
jgi:hypothetical protein